MVELKLPPLLVDAPPYWKNFALSFVGQGLNMRHALESESLTWNEDEMSPVVYFESEEHLNFFKIKWQLKTK